MRGYPHGKDILFCAIRTHALVRMRQYILSNLQCYVSRPRMANLINSNHILAGNVQYQSSTFVVPFFL